MCPPLCPQTHTNSPGARVSSNAQSNQSNLPVLAQAVGEVKSPRQPLVAASLWGFQAWLTLWCRFSPEHPIPPPPLCFALPLVSTVKYPPWSIMPQMASYHFLHPQSGSLPLSPNSKSPLKHPSQSLTEGLQELKSALASQSLQLHPPQWQ